MLYFANPCTPGVVAAMLDGKIGYIDTPAQGNRRPAGVTWCVGQCGSQTATTCTVSMTVARTVDATFN